MRYLFLILALALMLAGCNKAKRVVSLEKAEAKVEHKRKRGMAYEHEVEFQAPRDKTRSIFEAVKQACTALPERGCTVLEASLHSGQDAGATVTMRIRPDGVNQVLHALDGRGKLLSQTTRAEDLAEPVQDGARKLAMLTAYRAKLEALSTQRGLSPEALIKLHRELAEVESEIETHAGEQARLQQRIDTEKLTVAVREELRDEERDEIVYALKDFGRDLQHGVASLISFIAAALPFAVFGGVGYAFWRRWRRRSAAPKQR